MGVAFGFFLFFMFVGAPIVVVLGLSSTLALYLTTDVPIATIAQRIFGTLNGFTLMAIPFFIFAGIVMDAGGLSRRIVNFAAALVGWLTGSLLHIAIIAATGLAAISGSGTADTAAVSSIMGPEMRRRRYDIDFATAIIACAGSQAQVVPPSLMLVIIASVSNLSVGALFLAGVIPGMLTMSALHVVAHIHAHRGGPQYKSSEPFSLERLGRTLVAALPALGMPVIIVGGIVGGVFTPTEAAAIAAFYGLLIGLFVYRDLSWRAVPSLVNRAVGYSAGILMIVSTASILGWIVANANLPQALEAWLGETVAQPWTYLLIVNLLLLIVGCFMESLAAILILTPVMLPIAVGYGIDPIHFSLVMVMNFAIGLVTPPFGGALFTASTVVERDVMSVARRITWPFIAMASTLLLVTYVPEVSLFLPRAAGLID